MADGQTFNTARCSDCQAYLGPDIPEQRKPCPVCGSVRRTVGISTAAGALTLGPRQVHLTQFVDTSSGTAANVTTTALKEIANWVGQVEPLTVTHVIEGHIPPQKAGVPVGPYDDSKIQDILTTIENHNADKKAHLWDVVEKIRLWVVPIIVALITSTVVTTLFLKYWPDN